MLGAVINAGTAFMVLAVAAALLGIGAFLYRNPDYRLFDLPLGGLFYTYVAPRLRLNKPADIINRDRLALEQLNQRMDASHDPAAQLPLVQANSTVVVEGKRYLAEGVFALLALRFYDSRNKANKVHNAPNGTPLPRYIGASLSEHIDPKISRQPEQRVMVHLPLAEGLEQVYFWLEPVSGTSTAGFTSYLKGTDTHPGPAKQFADQDQAGLVIFDQFPGVPGTWQATDLVWARVLTRGKPLFANADLQVDESDDADLKQLPLYVLFVAKEEEVPDENARWMITFEARDGRGQNMVFRGHLLDVDQTRDTGMDLEEVWPVNRSLEGSI